MSSFAEIYRQNTWGFGSGHGSLASVTGKYRKFLEQFIRTHRIRTIVDFGCGDWQFSRLIDWGAAEYLGLDIVEDVIERNRREFSRPNVRFEAFAGTPADLPEADLLISKDVLQHWDAAAIAGFIQDALPKFRFALITNCILPEAAVNSDIPTGGFRPLDLRRPPFSLRADCVLTFDGPRTFSLRALKHFPAWRKNVLLVERPAPH